MNNGPAGFQNAPVTKGFIITSAILSFAIGIHSGSTQCSISYNEVIEKYHLWKLATSAFVFTSTPELIFGLCLLYYFRVFERQIGSNKFSVFVAFSIVLAILVEYLYLVIAKDSVSNGLASGPYSLIFSSFIPFFLDIPVSTHFRTFGVQFSDKAFVYLAGLQLLFSSWRCSLIPGLCGFLAGMSYRINILGIRRVKFPDQLASLVSHIPWPLISFGSSVSPSRVNNSTGASHILDRQLEEEAAAASPLLEEIRNPSEEAISTLVAMGFDRNLAIQALIIANNDLSAATNSLLEMQSRSS